MVASLCLALEAGPSLGVSSLDGRPAVFSLPPAPECSGACCGCPWGGCFLGWRLLWVPWPVVASGVSSSGASWSRCSRVSPGFSPAGFAQEFLSWLVGFRFAQVFVTWLALSVAAVVRPLARWRCFRGSSSGAPRGCLPFGTTWSSVLAGRVWGVGARRWAVRGSVGARGPGIRGRAPEHLRGGWLPSRRFGLFLRTFP